MKRHRMEKERKKLPGRYPVVTLVLYFGYKKHWDKARSLYEALGKNLDSGLEPFVNDYKINLFEVAWLTDEQVAGFKSDFRIVADYFVQMRKTGTYQGTVSDVRHMREVLQLLSVLTDDLRFQKIIEDVKKVEEPKNMSEVLDRIEKKGIEQGIEAVNMLNARLLKDGRFADLERSVSDSAYQKQLLSEIFQK